MGEEITQEELNEIREKVKELFVNTLCGLTAKEPSDCDLYSTEIEELDFNCFRVRCDDCKEILKKKASLEIDKIFNVESEYVFDSNSHELRPGMSVYVPTWNNIGPFSIHNITGDEIILQYDISGNLRSVKAAYCMRMPESIYELNKLLDCGIDYGALDKEKLSFMFHMAYCFGKDDAKNE